MLTRSAGPRTGKSWRLSWENIDVSQQDQCPTSLPLLPLPTSPLPSPPCLSPYNLAILPTLGLTSLPAPPIATYPARDHVCRSFLYHPR